MNEPGEVEVYVAHLADDEAAAVAMAAVHLAGKATDAPTRLSHASEAVRSPQGGSMAKRCWPLAAPWRDQVLLAEQRLLRCLNYDVRTEKIKQVLADLCAVMEDERYPTWAGTGARFPRRSATPRPTCSRAPRSSTAAYSRRRTPSLSAPRRSCGARTTSSRPTSRRTSSRTARTPRPTPGPSRPRGAAPRGAAPRRR